MEALAGHFEKSTGKFSWDKRHVVNAMDEAVVAVKPQPRFIVGMDAKYFLDAFSRLPTSWRVNWMPKKPALLNQKSL